MSGRHTGGVQGTRFLRADCPVCGRDTAGGNMSRDRRRIALKPHKRLPERAEWCPGGGEIVTPRAYLDEVRYYEQGSNPS